MMYLLITIAAFTWFAIEISGLLFGFQFPASFRFYRKWRGGRWARTSKGWHRLPHTCGEKHDEQWRKVYCAACAHCSNQSKLTGCSQCLHPRELYKRQVTDGSWAYPPEIETCSGRLCSQKNQFNDCPDFRQYRTPYY